MPSFPLRHLSEAGHEEGAPTMPSHGTPEPDSASTRSPGVAVASRPLTILALAMSVLLLPVLVHLWIDAPLLSVALVVAQECIIVITLLLNRAGRSIAASGLFTSGAWVLVCGLALLSESGSHDVALLALPPVLLGAGILVGPRFLWSMTTLSVAALATLWIGEKKGWIINAMVEHTEYSDLVDGAVILIMTATATMLITGDFRRALGREKKNAEALASSQRELEKHATALERSELRFRTAIELAADGILLADENARVTEVNSRACTLLDRARAAIVGRSLFDLLPTQDGESAVQARTRIDRGEIITCERTLKHTDRHELIVETTWQRLPDRTLQCFVRDISGRRRMEEQLRHAQKMEAVGALAGGIAHDFNNLLTVMQGFLELIEDDPVLTPGMAANVAELKAASTHAADLTQQLLAFAGRRPLQRRAVDLRDILLANQRLVERLVSEAVTVVVEPLDAPCPVYADPSMIAQIILNLAANARDAMPKGGDLRFAAIPPAARTPPRLGTEGFVVRDYTGFRAIDTGTGITSEAAQRIFEPFFTTKESGKGTGLGLAMVHGIVERHGGWVEVQSVPGRGTEFLIYLPVHAPPEIPASASAVHHPAGESAATILVVDDDPAIRRLARQNLLHHGFSVVDADSGAEALAAWDEHAAAIDLVFTDMVMPGGMNGLQLIQACRARQSGIAAILTSGYTLPRPGSAPDYPADIALLSKPYANHVLVETVKTALAARRDVARGNPPV